MTHHFVGGIEAGGTKMICAVATSGGTVLEQARFATGDPDNTFETMAAFFHQAVGRHGPIGAGGIASFGPLDLEPGSPHFGSLTMTPKPGWAGVDMLGRVRAILQAPVLIDTDVNCAARAEAKHGAARGLDRISYITVGTGIGVGIVENGATNAGTGHPEVGHIRVGRPVGDDFAGICPRHGDCVEGLASGPAMMARWGCGAEDLPAGHVAWSYEAHYIAEICVNLTYTVRPQRIILGGGVMEHAPLLEAVRSRFRELMGGYALDRYSSDVETFLCAPQLRDPSPGLVGAIDLACAAVAARDLG